MPNHVEDRPPPPQGWQISAVQGWWWLPMALGRQRRPMRQGLLAGPPQPRTAGWACPQWPFAAQSPASVCSPTGCGTRCRGGRASQAPWWWQSIPSSRLAACVRVGNGWEALGRHWRTQQRAGQDSEWAEKRWEEGEQEWYCGRGRREKAGSVARHQL